MSVKKKKEKERKKEIKVMQTFINDKFGTLMENLKPITKSSLPSVLKYEIFVF